MSSFAIERPAQQRRGKAVGVSLLAAYIAIYAATLLAMVRFGKFDAAESLGVFAVLGIGFSFAAWLLTIGVQPLQYRVLEPRKESAMLLVYLVPLAAFIAYGFSAIHSLVPGEPADSIVILIAKLAIFVGIPAWIMMSRFGYKLGDLAPLSLKTSHLLVVLGMSLVLLIFQSVAGRGLRDIADAHVPGDKLLLGIPLVFLWLVLEVGVVEEFFFRVLLQSRLSATLRSELGGIVLMSLIFGLVHAPGLYLRTNATQEGLSAHPSLLMAVGYSIVITSVAGFFLGVLWARTRNFLVLVLVHAATDLLPNTLPTLRAFHILK
ncbi:MAG: CPBP family intramembrane glutamic endopeptidase [Candidatus Korobacteraceae bacterium]